MTDPCFRLAATTTGLALLAMALTAAGCAQEHLNAGASGNPYGAWEKGPPSDPSFFPIAVWLQAPKNAARFKAAGINLYIALWQGPTPEQLSELEAAGMPVVCHQNEVGLAYQGDIIVGWMHGDEPDNAQSLGEGKGWGPPILPEKIVADYERVRATDPSRPVLLNLGQGVAWDGWYGRGVRTNHPEDYADYVKGADIVSFDIYPAVHDKPEVAGNLWFVPHGVDRLREWTGDQKVVWNCVECSRISNTEVKPTAQQIRAEVWMSLIHGSMGLIYFVHQFRPNFVEASLLQDEELLPAVTAINQQIHELAPVLNSPSVPEAASVSSSDADVPIDIMAKRHEGATYVFAVAMRDGETTGTFTVEGTEVEVLGEERTIPIVDGKFSDSFGGCDVHLYRVR